VVDFKVEREIVIIKEQSPYTYIVHIVHSLCRRGGELKQPRAVCLVAMVATLLSLPSGCKLLTKN
jgi:hypothetical protein